MKCPQRPTIIVRSCGGLGNQMFQYAAGRGIADHLGARLLVDTSHYDGSGSRSFQLDRMRVPLEIATAADVKEIVPPYPHGASTVRKLLFRARHGRAMKERIFVERSFHFDERAFRIRPPAILDGYFVSLEYFKHIEKDIRAQFRLRDPLGANNAAVGEQIASHDSSVAMHIRRGDYVKSLGVNGVHGLCSDAYYERAMAVMNAVVLGQPRYFVFSDDPQAARDFSARYPDCVPVAGGQDRPWEQMHLMARCHHQIIANSTFSWWAAWLNCNPRKIVIGPREWFRKGVLRAGRNLVDLFPAEWITIGSE